MEQHPEIRPKKTRRAVIWTPKPAPSLMGLFRGREARQEVITYLRGDATQDAIDLSLYHLFRLLPTPLISAIGGRISQYVGPTKYPKSRVTYLDNLKMLRPELSEAERTAYARRHYDNIGRSMTEFSVMDRIGASDKLTFENGALAQRLHAEGPLVLLGLHTANWEIAAAVFARLGIRCAAIYAPPARHAHHSIAVHARSQFGIHLLPPGKAGARPALRALQGGEALAVHADEEFDNHVMAPFFHRPPHLDGNLAVVARLCRMSGAKVLVYHGERRPGGRYHLIFGPEVTLPSQANPKTELIEDVVRLNAAIEPIVLAHCDNWLFMDRPFY